MDARWRNRARPIGSTVGVVWLALGLWCVGLAGCMEAKHGNVSSGVWGPDPLGNGEPPGESGVPAHLTDGWDPERCSTTDCQPHPAGCEAAQQCELVYTPSTLFVGPMGPGTVVVQSIGVLNNGDGDCRYTEPELVPCVKRIEPLDGYDCASSHDMGVFELLAAPPPGAVLRPGEVLPFAIRVDAPEQVYSPQGDSYYARFTAWFYQGCDEGLTAPLWGSSDGSNVHALVGTAGSRLRIRPDPIDLGVRRYDCGPGTREVELKNLGPFDLQVQSVQLVGCPPGIQLSPDGTGTIAPHGKRTLTVSDGSVIAGVRQCVLRVVSSDFEAPIQEVPIRAEVTDQSQGVDVFLQDGPQMADILFVIDNSGSMSDEQQVLAEQLPWIVEQFAVGPQSYHLGVVTTDVAEDRGWLQGQPRYYDHLDDPGSAADNLLVGADGSAREEGIRAAALALSPKLAVSTDTLCTSDWANCPPDTLCLDGQCRGPNSGFVRENAHLVLVFIGDEDDQSMQRSVAGWAEELKSHKAGRGAVHLSAHALVTPATGCGDDYSSYGERFIELVDAFAGQVEDICQEHLGAGFAAIGERLFGPRDRFYPDLPPVPETLVVSVDGEACTTGWTWRPDLGAVIFDPDGPCFPPFESEVAFTYEVACSSG